jgi:antirestriction protein
MVESDTKRKVQIYVACLAAYNNGYLHGAWIDATQEVDDINDAIKVMLSHSPIERAEEYAIHDHEGFETAQIGEYETITHVAELASFITQHGAVAAELFNHFGDVKSAKTAMSDHYAGCHERPADYAEELTDEQALIPDHLRPHIDYEKMAADMAINDWLVLKTAWNEHHIFWLH